MYIELDYREDIYFISDSHYHHKNIVSGCSGWKDVSLCRKFKTLEEHDQYLIKLMNTAKEDSIIFHLGDWSFGGIEYISEFRKQIRCQSIYLTYGNHDHYIKKNKENLQDLFTACSERIYLNVKGVAHLVLDHYPIVSWESMNKGWIHLHGHVHLQPKDKIHKGKSMDVGIDGLNKPQLYSLDEVCNLLKDNPIAVNTLPNDHHEEEVR